MEKRFHLLSGPRSARYHLVALAASLPTWGAIPNLHIADMAKRSHYQEHTYPLGPWRSDTTAATSMCQDSGSRASAPPLNRMASQPNDISGKFGRVETGRRWRCDGRDRRFRRGRFNRG